MRPPSIVAFERLFLAAFVVGLINTLLLTPRLLAQPSVLSHAARVGTVVVGLLLGAALILALWYFVARLGSAIAKWIVMAEVAYTVFSLVYGLAHGTISSGLLGVSLVSAAVLQVLAAAMLFRADARPWFSRDASSVEPLA